MKILKYVLPFIVLLFFVTPSFAQKKGYDESDYQNWEVEMADQMRKDGKIYVVVAVMTTILIGLFVYTITIDRKISSLEKVVNQKTQKTK